METKNIDDNLLLHKLLVLATKHLDILESLHLKIRMKEYSEENNIKSSTLSNYLKSLTNYYLIKKDSGAYCLTELGFEILFFLNGWKERIIPSYRDLLDSKYEQGELLKLPPPVRSHMSIEVNGVSKKINKRLKNLKRKEKSLIDAIVREINMK